jgi:hypothetical protein
VLLHKQAVKRKVSIAQPGNAKLPVPKLVETAKRQMETCVNNQEDARKHESTTTRDVGNKDRQKK